VSAALEVMDLTKRFPGRVMPALDGVRLQVADRSFTCMLGASGSGKSTLLGCIAGLVEPDDGEVLIDGVSLAGTPPHRRPLTLVLQTPQLFPFLDVVENVEFGLKVRGVARRQRRARASELLDATGLGGFEQRRVSSLSGGEAQRVALARALAVEPRVLLLDEPLSSLDPGVRRELQDLLVSLHRSLGATTVMVTHDRNEAFALADHLVVLDNGRIVGDGPPQALYARPPSAAVARLLGVDNTIDGHVVHAEHVRLVAVGSGRRQGRVAGVRFAGAHCEVRVELDDGGRVDALVATTDAPEVGAQTGVSW
jgi:ABC-type Fe3+/spermidine/putrescine transport system ATPase subunit